MKAREDRIRAARERVVQAAVAVHQNVDAEPQETDAWSKWLPESSSGFVRIAIEAYRREMGVMEMKGMMSIQDKAMVPIRLHPMPPRGHVRLSTRWVARMTLLDGVKMLRFLRGLEGKP